MRSTFALLSLLILALGSTAVFAKPGGVYPHGLKPQAEQELKDANVDKYAGQFTPAVSFPVGEGWIKHTFDPGAAFDGPLCVAGTPYSVFTKQGNPAKLLIMLQGGGACWQDFYSCNVLSENQEPPPPQVGIWDEVSGVNPLDDWSIVYLPYCDGSVFTGDNDVFDPAWQAFIEGALGLEPGTGPIVRFHRGLRNATAGIDLAKQMFPRASRILVAGSSAGGVGATAFAPFLVRMAFGNNKKLMVFNDAGPVAINLADAGAIAARAADWMFGQFYPSSCEQCDALGQGTGLIKWRLANDSTIREAFYSTDFDLTNRFYLNMLPTVLPDDPLFPLQLLATGLAYRQLIISEHGEINALFPDRYKRFIQAGRTTHTALQTPVFYESANGVPLYEWLADFLVPRPSWQDIVEELPLP